MFARPVYAAEQIAQSSAVLTNGVITADERVERLSQFLHYHNSPLQPYAQDFVTAADKYELPDWSLLPAITGVESTFGKAIPHDSYNAYGWANGAYSFSSWSDSIDHVAKALKEKYYDRGFNTVEKIGKIYAPPSQTWSGKVLLLMKKIKTFIPRDTHELSFVT